VAPQGARRESYVTRQVETLLRGVEIAININTKFEGSYAEDVWNFVVGRLLKSWAKRNGARLYSDEFEAPMTHEQFMADWNLPSGATSVAMLLSILHNS
jgi:hypothetical protein